MLFFSKDALIIDLEDSVLPAEKPAARAEVGRWMSSVTWGDKTVCVASNGSGDFLVMYW